ncbi:MAG: hypothetical protein IKB43_09165 [Fibrobacter sp.]|nr:hypothetical protein [Fibrobacter sp.]
MQSLRQAQGSYNVGEPVDPLDTEGKFTDKVPMWKGEGSPSLQPPGSVFRYPF